MLSKYKIFFLIFIPAALALMAGISGMQQKNSDVSAAQFEKLLKNQWRLVSLLQGTAESQAALAALADSARLRVTRIRPDGQVLFDSATSGGLESHKDREEIRSALAGVPAMVTRYSHSTNEHTIYYAEKLPNGDVLRVAYPAEYYREQQKALLRQTSVSLAALVVAVLAFALLVSRRSSGTFKRLSLAVDAARRGETDLPSFDSEELDSALYSLSVVTRELKASSDENSNLNSRLEYILNTINEGVLLLAGSQVVYHNRRASEILNYAIPRDLTSITNKEMIDLFASFNTSKSFELRMDQRVISVDQTHSGDTRLVILHDISDQERYSGYKSDLVGNISHELKTPLNLIMTTAEVITKDASMPRQILEKFLTTIYKNTQRLNDLIDNLMFLHELENSQRSNTEEIDLDDILSEFKVLLDAHNKSISYSYDPVTVRICGTHLLSILTNLVSNAVNYSNGEHIAVDIKKRESTLQIRVSDAGPEIPAAERERIFERFYSLSKSRNRNNSGSGLGLAIVKHIARLYNGQARVTSNEHGGNTFVVRLVEK